MSHKIAQARKLGLTGRAADRFGHGGFQSQTTTGQVVGTPPSARRVFRPFETPKTQDKTNSFLSQLEEKKDLFRSVEATLAARQRIRRRDFGVAQDLISEFTPTSPRQDILKQATDRQAEIRKEELAKIQGEARFIKQQEASEIIPTIDLKPLSAEDRKERSRLLRQGDPALREFLPISPQGRLRNLINDEIKESVPEHLQAAVKGEINLRRSQGEIVSPKDVKFIAVQVNPRTNLEFDRLFSAIPVIDPTDLDAAKEKILDEGISKLAFSGAIADQDALDTPGKELTDLIFRRAGELQRDPSSAKRFIDLVEGEELPHPPLPVPEELLSELPEGELTLEQAIDQAQGELQFEVRELIQKEDFRVFQEQLKSFRDSTKLIGGGQLEELSTLERRDSVRDKWAASLYDVNDFSGLNIKQATFLDNLLFDPRGGEGRFQSTNTAITRMLDIIDPETIPAESRVEYIEQIRDMALAEQGIKVGGVTIVPNEFELYMTLFSLWKWPAYTTLGYIGAELGARGAEEVGVSPVLGGLIGAIALGALGGPKLTRLTNDARTLAATKTPLLPIRARQGLLPKPDVAKLHDRPLSQLEVEEINVRNLRINAGAETIIDPAGRTISRNIRGLKTRDGRQTIKKSVTERQIAKLNKEEQKELLRRVRNVPSDAEAIIQDELAHIARFKANPPGKVARDIAKAAKKTEKEQRVAVLDTFEAEARVESAIFNFVSKTTRIVYQNIVGESPLITRLKQAQRTLKTTEGEFAVKPLTQIEQKLLDSLNDIHSGKIKAGTFSESERSSLDALKALKHVRSGAQDTAFGALLAKAAKARKSKILTPEQVSKRNALISQEAGAKLASSRISRIESVVSGGVRGGDTVLFGTKAKEALLKIVRTSEKRARGIAESKIPKITKQELKVAFKSSQIPFNPKASVSQLSEQLLQRAKVVGKISEVSFRAQTVKSVNALQNEIAALKSNLDAKRLNMGKIAEESDRVKGFNDAISHQTEILNPRAWNLNPAVLRFGKDKLGGHILAMERDPTEVMKALSEVLGMGGKEANLGVAQKARHILGKPMRMVTGNSVVAEGVVDTGHIIQSAEMMSRVREITRTRAQAFILHVNSIAKDIGVLGKESSFYTGPKLPETVRGQKYPHSLGDIVSQPELYAKLSEDQLIVIRMIQQSIDDNLLIPERLLGVPTKTLEEAMSVATQGLEAFEGFPVRGMSVKSGYWPQYLDSRTLEQLLGKTKVVGVSRGQGRQAAFLKSRNYPNRMELWKDLVAKNKGDRIDLMPSDASMEARFGDSGRAMGLQLHKDNILRNIEHRTTKTGGFLSSVEGFEGVFFKTDVAIALKTQRQTMMAQVPARALRNAVNLVRNMKLASDFSAAIGIQGYFFLSQAFTNPLALSRYVKNASHFAFSEEAFQAMLANKLPTIIKLQSKGLILNLNPVDLRQVTRNNLGFGTGKTINVPGKIADIINNATFGRMVSYYKISMAEQYLEIMRSSKAFKGFAALADSVPNIRKTLGFSVKGAAKLSDDAIAEAVMASINNRFGGISQAMIGKGSTRVLVEQLLDIAPNWLRARTNIYVNLFKGNTAERYLALNSIGREYIVASIISTVLSELLVGELPNLTDPTKFDFLAVKTPLGVVPVIPSQALANLFVNASHLLGKTVFEIASGDDPIDTVLDNSRTLWEKGVRKIRGREGPALSILIEQMTGKDFFGNKFTDFEDRLRAFGLGFVPIWMEDVVESIERGESLKTVTTRFAVAIAGVNMYPKSPFELVIETTTKWARLLFGEAVNENGKLRYGPEVVYEELDGVDRDDVDKELEVIAARETAKQKAEDLSLNSAFDSDEYKEKVEYLHETGYLLENGEQGRRINNTTQAEDDKNLNNRDLEGPNWIGNYYDKLDNEGVVASVYRSEQGIEFEPKEPINDVDKFMLAYWELDRNGYIENVTGAFDGKRWTHDRDELHDLAVEAGRKSGGDVKARKVSETLRPKAESHTVRNFHKAAAINKEVEEMPKYKWLTVEESDQVDSLIEMATGVARVLKEEGRGTSVAKILKSVAEAGIIDEKVAYVALFRQMPELRQLAWNPDRDALVMDNPQSVVFYPRLYEGLSEKNKIEFRRTQGDGWFSKLWLFEEEEELNKPEILRGLDIDLGGSSGIQAPSGARKGFIPTTGGVLGVSTFGELEEKEPEI